MSQKAERWTLDALLNHIRQVDTMMKDHQFCWVIGAGASKQSGIPTGAELADWWLRELYEQECEDKQATTIKKWTSKKKLGIDRIKFSKAAQFYPQIYERRFKEFPQHGFAYLEHVMTGRPKRWDANTGRVVEAGSIDSVIEPSPGYSILAKTLEKSRHRAVVTTNFDNLVVDALQIYTDTYPFVCGHELLTGFVQVFRERPLICKIHRDLLLDPLNSTRGIHRLHEAWAATLRSLFSHYTPFFIGYGGNDPSLMGRLRSFASDEIRGRPIWCYYEGRDRKLQPSPEIDSLVSEHHGVLVPVPDFDRLMILIGCELGIKPLDHVLEERAKRQTDRYQRQILGLETRDYPQLLPAVRATYERAGLGWWGCQLEVDSKKSDVQKEAVYRRALEALPDSVELHCNFAIFLKNVRKDHDEAEQLYRRALELDPNSAWGTTGFANFMTDVRKDHVEAERLYKRALELDPDSAWGTASFALFMTNERKNHDEAERLYKRALELDPDYAVATGNFASFMTDVRKDHDEAERLYRRALELDPKNARAIGSFANFMTEVRKDHEEAERLYRRALELDPDYAWATCSFANFMTEVRKDHDEAERLYRRALELDPDYAWATCSFANFMKSVRKDHDEAERLYRRALELDPDYAWATCSFANFMKSVRKDHDEAERLYRRALELDPDNANSVANFAESLVLAKAYAEADEMAKRALELVEVEDVEVRAAMLLIQSMAQCLSAGDSTDAEARLVELLQSGVEPGSWSFELLLDVTEGALETRDFERFRTYADAIKDPAAASRINETLADIARKYSDDQHQQKKPRRKKAARRKGQTTTQVGATRSRSRRKGTE